MLKLLLSRLATAIPSIIGVVIVLAVGIDKLRQRKNA